jgi:hypothetical protein
MTAIITSLIGGLTGFVVMVVGAALVLFNTLPGISPATLDRTVRRRRVLGGSISLGVGLAIALGSFAFGFFGSLPGPNFIKTWSEARTHLRKQDPAISVTGLDISYPLSSERRYYDLRVTADGKTIKLRLWYDPVTKQTIRIEDLP